MDNSITQARARVAALTRSRQPHDQHLLNARRDLAFANLRKIISKTINNSPALSDAQNQELKALLSGTEAADE